MKWFDRLDIVQMGRTYDFIEELRELAMKLYNFKSVNIYKNPLPETCWDFINLEYLVDTVKPGPHVFFVLDKRLKFVDRIIDDTENGDPEHRGWMGLPYEIIFGMIFGLEKGIPIGFMTNYYVSKHRPEKVHELSLKIGLHEIGHMRGYVDCNNLDCLLYRVQNVFEKNKILSASVEEGLSLFERIPLKICEAHK